MSPKLNINSSIKLKAILKLISSIARSSNVSLIVLEAKGFELKRNLKNIASLIVELTSCTMLLVP